MKGGLIMRKNIIGLIGLALIATSLGGCVVYDRPYHPYYYHGWYYR
jgi:hypothetical protein